MLVLKEGDKGPDVKRLQHLLNSRVTPNPHLPTNGIFDPLTTAALKRFQALAHLKGDGIAGRRVWTALGQLGTPRARLEATVAGCVAAAPWLSIAALELGVHEDSRVGHHNARIVEYHSATSLKATTDEVAWCSSFVNWVLKQAGHAGSNSALAKSWLNWGNAREAPSPGAITVVKLKGATSDAATGSTTGYHVAFFIEKSTTHVRLLGGNQGDQVKYSNYALASYSVEGYRWPCAPS